MVKKIILITILCCPFLIGGLKAHGEVQDLRSYQHGVEIIETLNNELLLFWSSGGNPPSGQWTHDVFVSPLNRNNPVIQPAVLISKDEAQEPVSVAINNEGNIMVTMEDGWNAQNEIAQRYGVYTSRLEPVRAYPQLVLDGGHSGHVASAGNRFVIFYSEGWIDGEGVDNLGSGNDVYAAVFSSQGVLEQTVHVAVGPTRDWWPLIAGSQSHVALTWQRFVPGEIYADLMFAVLDPSTGTFVLPPTQLAKGVRYYTYSVDYISSIDRFLVRGSYHVGGGFGYLVDTSGKVTGTNMSLPAIVRESQPAVRNENGIATVVQPRSPSGISVIELTSSSLTLNEVKDSDGYRWQYMGTDGVFLNNFQVYIVALSNKGLVEKTYTIPLQQEGGLQNTSFGFDPFEESALNIQLAQSTQISLSAKIESDSCARSMEVLFLPISERFFFTVHGTRTLTAQILLASWCAYQQNTHQENAGQM